MGRRFLVAGLTGLLAACGAGDRGPFSASLPPPGLAERFYPPEGWAWGFVTPANGAAQRYGVSAPAGVVRGHILVLPDYGEIAETWFETARDLNGRGYAVWVLDGPGQGGSARQVSPRDLGYARDLASGAEAARIMAASVIPQDPRRPLVVLGQGDGTVLAVMASEAMASGPRALILDSPPPAAPIGEASMPSDLDRWLGLDRRRAPAGRPWSRGMADDFARGVAHDRWRGAVTLAWQRADPPLRLGGPSRAWSAAFDQARSAAARDESRLRAPILVVEGDGARGCGSLPRCSAAYLPGAGPALELERDATRNAWLNLVESFAAVSSAKSDTARALHPPPSPIESASPASGPAQGGRRSHGAETSSRSIREEPLRRPAGRRPPIRDQEADPGRPGA